jgi:hypothetical protein
MLLKRFCQTDAQPLSCPLEPGVNLSKTDCPATDEARTKMDMTPYKELIRSLMCAAICTRPDIAFAVSMLSQFMVNPSKVHWRAALRVLCYLKGTCDKGLYFGYNDTVTTDTIAALSDTDWASQEHRHSFLGYVYTINGGAVSWSAKKQPLVVLSSTEAEYIALMHAAKEAMWLWNLLSDLGRPMTSPLVLHCDNQSAIALTKDNAYHAQTKHFDIHHHFIHEQVECKIIEVTYVNTDENTADIFTKALNAQKVEHHNEGMNLFFPFSNE